MAESRVGFLYGLSNKLSHLEDKRTAQILRSYYLMRCKTLVGANALPDQQFSIKVRCPKCCLEWSKNTEVKVKQLKLSKRQKKRIKSRKRQTSEDYIKNLEKINSNQIEQTCAFCTNCTLTTSLKPKGSKRKDVVDISDSQIPVVLGTHNSTPKPSHLSKTAVMKKNKEINVYSNSIDVFSLKNKDNTLATSQKEQPKIIKNNKRKKDKFAGLCQKAVLMSAKLKEEKDKQSPLNLFLKPSANK